MKSRNVLSIIALLTAVCMIAGCKDKLHPLYRQYQYPNEQYFGVDVYSEILYECTEDERKAVAPIMAEAEKVFCYVGPKVKADDAVGALIRYYPHQDIAFEEHALKLITVKLEKRTGAMWIAYYCVHKDSDGNVVYRAGTEKEMILARWGLEQRDGTWMVTEIREAP